MNTLTVLRCNSPDEAPVSAVRSPNILSNSELRSFWLTWMNGTIEFGIGDAVGTSPMLMYTDPDPAYRRFVHSLAVASLADELAEWEFGGSFETGKAELFSGETWLSLLVFKLVIGYYCHYYLLYFTT